MLGTSGVGQAYRWVLLLQCYVEALAEGIVDIEPFSAFTQQLTEELSVGAIILDQDLFLFIPWTHFPWQVTEAGLTVEEWSRMKEALDSLGV